MNLKTTFAKRSTAFAVISRIAAAVLVATLWWAPSSARIALAIYCYSGDPPAVYQACLAYNQGIGRQVNNQQQLQNIQSQINNAVSQINAIDTLISNLKAQIAAQQALISQTQATIDDLSRQIRFGEAKLVQLEADTAVRDQLLNQRIRYVDD